MQRLRSAMEEISLLLIGARLYLLLLRLLLTCLSVPVVASEGELGYIYTWVKC